MAMMKVSRRSFMTGAAALASAAAGNGLMSALVGARAAEAALLRPRLSEFEILPGKPTKSIFAYSDAGPPPVLRAKQGQPFKAVLTNELADEPTTVHFHGIRLPNNVDGVPFLTQPYIYKGESFTYDFSPPDAGTYWYHPHCNSLVQTSRGLTGVLIVEEAKPIAFDAEIVLNLRDWRLGRSGQFIKLYKLRKTARNGTLGTVRTTNWQQNPNYDAPAGSLLRLRIADTDATRIYRFTVDGADAKVIALDGNPVPEPVALADWPVGPGQRMELAIRMPDEEGKTVTITNHASNRPFVVARLRALGASLKRDLRDFKGLPANPVERADLKNAEVIPLEFTATADQIAKSKYCGTLGYSFWAINRRPWSGIAPDPDRPLFEMKLGRSYIIDLKNRTPHSHPIHLHGMSFQLLRSNRRKVPPLVTDTAMLLPDEQIQVALVADNPGDWLLHCHVLEHQKTGMSGVMRVA